ncbi:MAG: hypothetical protein II712_02340 [Erysipelotrichaceae bacterium]|nr:hypothetical protein [Erysipelotrichaceae bacterium]
MIVVYLLYGLAYLFVLGQYAWNNQWNDNILPLLLMAAMTLLIGYLSLKKLRKKEHWADVLIIFAYLLYVLVMQYLPLEAVLPPTAVLLAVTVYFSIRLITVILKAESGKKKAVAGLLLAALIIAGAPVLYSRKGSAAYTYIITSNVSWKQLKENELIFGDDAHYGMTADIRSQENLPNKEETDLHWLKQKRIGPWIISYFAGYG